MKALIETNRELALALDNLLREVREIYDKSSEPDGTEECNPYGVCESDWLAGTVCRETIIEAKLLLGYEVTKAEQDYLSWCKKGRPHEQT